MANRATAKDRQNQHGSRENLSVYKTEKDGEYFVEGSEGKICYRVTGNNGSKSCTCTEYLSNIQNNPGFVCKHIQAVIGANGNAAKAYPVKGRELKLDDRFIKKIQGREFVVYSGLLDLAHQKGVKSIIVEAIQLPTKDNGMEAICKAFVESVHSEEYIEYGDANPRNVAEKIASHILRMAATRAKARALRDFTNIGMTCLEELGDLNDVAHHDTRPSRKVPSNNPPRKAPPKGTKPASGPPTQAKTQPNTGYQRKTTAGVNGDRLTQAQRNAILNLAGRRKISEEELETMAMEMFATDLNNLTVENASALIRNLQSG